MWMYVLIGLAVIVVVFVAAVLTRPSNFRIVRMATIVASPAVVFEQINNFHNWEAWSPWAKLDPTMKQTYEGPESGTGAIYCWEGNNKVGQGRMTLTESKPHDRICINLEFIRPFACNNLTEFTFQRDGNRTAITWAMSGKNNFMGKAFDLLLNMDKMIGKDFEKGLAQIKSLVEAK